jgi:hypothetical protein
MMKRETTDSHRISERSSLPSWEFHDICESEKNISSPSVALFKFPQISHIFHEKGMDLNELSSFPIKFSVPNSWLLEESDHWQWFRATEFWIVPTRRWREPCSFQRGWKLMTDYRRFSLFNVISSLNHQEKIEWSGNLGSSPLPIRSVTVSETLFHKNVTRALSPVRMGKTYLYEINHEWSWDILSIIMTEISYAICFGMSLEWEMYCRCENSSLTDKTLVDTRCAKIDEIIFWI